MMMRLLIFYILVETSNIKVVTDDVNFNVKYGKIIAD